MALTDFNAVSIKDGVNGGIWREVREGPTGQAEAGRGRHLFLWPLQFQRGALRRVQPLLQFFTGVGAGLPVFEILWTVPRSARRRGWRGRCLVLHQRACVSAAGGGPSTSSPGPFPSSWGP